MPSMNMRTILGSTPVLPLLWALGCCCGGSTSTKSPTFPVATGGASTFDPAGAAADGPGAHAFQPSSEPAPKGATSVSYTDPASGVTSTIGWYQVLTRDVYDVPIKTQVELRLLVPTDISQVQALEIVRQVYDGVIKETGFRHQTHPNAVYIYAYPHESWEIDPLGWVAMADKSAVGQVSFTTQKRGAAATEVPSSDNQPSEFEMKVFLRLEEELWKDVDEDEAKVTARVAKEFGITPAKADEIYIKVVASRM